MIEETVLENARRGNFIRAFPSEKFSNLYKRFFEETRDNDIKAHNYIFNQRYKGLPIKAENVDQEKFNCR